MAQPPLAFDPANPLLGPGLSRLDTAAVSADGTKLGMVTIRTTSATVTVMLDPAELRTWAGLLSGLADSIGGGKLATATMADVVTLGRQ